MTERKRAGGTRLAIGVLLSALAGYVDAVGVGLLGGVFVSFMSGNTTQLGVALGTEGRLGFGAAVIAAFVTGAFVATLLRAAAGARLCLALLLAAEAGLLAVAAGLHTAGKAAAMGLALAFAMGMQNLARQQVAQAQTGGTFVTGTLVGLGQALAERLLGRPGASVLVQAAGWAALLAGAAGGAAVLGWLGPAAALGVPPAVLVLLALAVLR